MADDETLLDTFVNVGVKGIGKAETDIQTFVNKVKAVFGEGPELDAALKISGQVQSGLKQTQDQIAGVRKEMDQVRGKTLVAGKAVNNLGNNAYQLGQAFEDAAIGFQLNGIAGAVRGAANNVNFLIANLVESAVKTRKIKEETAALISIYAALGSVAAILILPPLVDWLESLNDIEAKSEDIAEIMKRGFSDARFAVSLELDARSQLRAIRDAEDAMDAFEEVVRQAEEEKKLQVEITAILSDVSKQEFIKDLQNTLRDAAIVIESELKNLRLFQLITDNGREFGTVRPADVSQQVEGFEELQAAVDSANISMERAFEQSRDGIVDVSSIQEARDSLRTLNDEFKLLTESGLLSEEDAAVIKKNLEAASAEFEKLAEQAQKANNIRLEEGIRAASEQAKILSAELEFQQAVNEGRLKDEDEILFKMQQEEVELQKRSELLRESVEGNELGEQLAEELILLNEQNLAREHSIELTAEIQDIQEEANEKRRQANEELLADAQRIQEAEEKLAEIIEDRIERQIEAQERLAEIREDALERERDLNDRIAESRERAQERVDDAQEQLDKATKKGGTEAAEAAIQDQIDALVDAKQDLDQSGGSFAVGTVRAVAAGVAGGEDSDEKRLKQLRAELRELRQQREKQEDAARVEELRKRLKEAQEDAAEAEAKFQKDLAKAKEEAKEREDEFNKEEAKRKKREAEREADANQNIKDLRQEQIESVNENSDEINKLTEQLRFLNERNGVLQNGGGVNIPELDAQGNRAGPIFAPEDFDVKAIGDAQANANAQAIRNNDFKSSSLEGLQRQTNRLLVTVNESLLKTDSVPRFV